MNKGLLWLCLTVGMIAGFASCDKENDEPEKPGVEQPGNDDSDKKDDVDKKDDTKLFSYFKPIAMSFHECKGVVLAELRSDISDLELFSATALDGYDVFFNRGDEMDAHGFYVYRAYVNMPEVKYGPNGELTKDAEFNIDLTFRGTGRENGIEQPVELQMSVPVKRYFKGSGGSIFLNLNTSAYLYLKEYKVVPFQNLISWNEERGEYEINKESVMSYSLGNSPLKGSIVQDYMPEQAGGRDWRYWNIKSTERLFGWGDKESIACGPELVDGNLNIGVENNKLCLLSLEYKEVPNGIVNNTMIKYTMVCCANEIDSEGNLIAQHIYTIVN